MPTDSAAEARAGLSQWADGARANAAELADMLGVPAEAYAHDPLVALGALQDYVSRLPLDEFEDDDWYTLHTDLASYLADVLGRRNNATWQVVDDPDTRRGFRYMLLARSLDGRFRRVDPYDVALEELQNPPVEITRMIANAEVVLGVSRTPVDS